MRFGSISAGLSVSIHNKIIKFDSVAPLSRFFFCQTCPELGTGSLELLPLQP